MAKTVLVLKILISLIFATTAVAKAMDLHEFQLSILASNLFGMELVPYIAKAIVALEFLVVVGIWVPKTASLSAIGGALLSGLFLGYSAWRGYYHIEVPCHCFGALLKMPPWGSGLLSAGLLMACLELKHRLAPSPLTGSAA